jgi:translation initiation factor 2D
VEEITDGVHELELPEKETTEQQSEEKGHPNLTTEEVDSLLNKCLLQALYTSIKEKDLPFPGSTLWYVCLLQFTPEYILLSD